MIGISPAQHSTRRLWQVERRDDESVAPMARTGNVSYRNHCAIVLCFSLMEDSISTQLTANATRLTWSQRKGRLHSWPRCCALNDTCALASHRESVTVPASLVEPLMLCNRAVNGCQTCVILRCAACRGHHRKKLVVCRGHTSNEGSTAPATRAKENDRQFVMAGGVQR